MRLPLLPVLATALVLLPSAPALGQTPLTTAFTYQGQLASDGVPATGAYDLRFRLFDAATDGNQIGSALCTDNLAVSDGRFTVTLDFGTAFAGQRRYLEILVRADAGQDCSDATEFTVLSPRQELTATPNATYAQVSGLAADAGTLGGQPSSFFTNAANLTGTVPSARLGGTYSNALTLTNASNVFAGSGSGLTNLSATNITGTLADDRLSSNIPKLSVSNTFSSPLNSFAGNLLVGGVEDVAFGIDSQPNPRLGMVKKFGVSPMIGATANQPIIFAHSSLDDFFNVAGATYTERLRIAANGNIQVPGGVLTNGTGPIPTADLGLYSQTPTSVTRFVTTNGAFQWFTDGGAGTTPRMTLSSAGNLSVTGTLSVTTARSTLAQEPWQVPTLFPGWSNRSGYSPAGYFKDSLGVVHLRGVLLTGGGAIFALPPGYRPSATMLFQAPTGGSIVTVQVEVQPSGFVFPVTNFSQYISLDGITFRAEQ